MNHGPASFYLKLRRSLKFVLMVVNTVWERRLRLTTYVFPHAHLHLIVILIKPANRP